ncbi:MAG: Rho termination factor N-terminal domain-containing protein, partial [Candidatus Margulisiibacteriota bacterium]
MSESKQEEKKPRAEKAEKAEKASAPASEQTSPKRNEDKDQVNNDQRLDMAELQNKNVNELYEIAEELKIPGSRQISKHDLVFKILQTKTEQSGFVFSRGVLEVLNEGYGFLRTNNYLPSSEDIDVTQTHIRKIELARADLISGLVRPPKEGERYFSLLR